MYAIYLSHIHHQFPPSSNSQISSNISASQIHVLLLIFIIYTYSVHMGGESFAGHGNLPMPTHPQHEGTLPP